MTSPAPVLLYLPGVTPIESNNAVRVAEVIASSQSVNLTGTFTVQLHKPDKGPRGACVVDPGGEVVLRVLEVDYRSTLAEKPGSGKSTDGWALLRSGRFALLGILRLLSARRRSKTGRHRLFFVLAFVFVLLMICAFLFLALAAIVAIGQFDFLACLVPDTSAGKVALGGGIASASGGLLWIRHHALDGSRWVREQVRYLEREQEAASVARVLDVAIDGLLEETPPPPAIHILAYSFGSIVALDALFSRVPRPPGVDRNASAITSLVTVGAPVDFVRQFYPSYFEKRIARRTDLPWTNLFLPEDILGSNFADNDDHSGFEAPIESIKPFKIEGVSPNRCIAVGNRRLSLRSLLSLEGFRVHGDYWDEAHRANLLEPVIRTWFMPPIATSAAVEPSAPSVEV